MKDILLQIKKLSEKTTKIFYRKCYFRFSAFVDSCLSFFFFFMLSFFFFFFLMLSFFISKFFVGSFLQKERRFFGFIGVFFYYYFTISCSTRVVFFPSASRSKRNYYHLFRKPLFNKRFYCLPHCLEYLIEPIYWTKKK